MENTKCRAILTNDDGYSSPFIQPFIHQLNALESIKAIECVLPAEERSWISQAMSRFEPVYVEKLESPANSLHIVNGTVADCVSLAISNLFTETIDYLFSGINVGTNAGLAFYFSSGTIGGARQAVLSGVKSAAFSAKVSPEIFAAWSDHDEASLSQHADHFMCISVIAASIAERLIRLKAWDNADSFSVNIPWGSSLESPAIFTSLEPTSYCRLFQEIETKKYLHKPTGLNRAPVPASDNVLPYDFATVDQGLISITPLYYLKTRTNDHKIFWQEFEEQFNKK